MPSGNGSRRQVRSSRHEADKAVLVRVGEDGKLYEIADVLSGLAPELTTLAAANNTQALNLVQKLAIEFPPNLPL